MQEVTRQLAERLAGLVELEARLARSMKQAAAPTLFMQAVEATRPPFSSQQKRELWGCAVIEMLERLMQVHDRGCGMSPLAQRVHTLLAANVAIS